jgi:hypothetical protein
MTNTTTQKINPCGHTDQEHKENKLDEATASKLSSLVYSLHAKDINSNSGSLLKELHNKSIVSRLDLENALETIFVTIGATYTEGFLMGMKYLKELQEDNKK